MADVIGRLHGELAPSAQPGAFAWWRSLVRPTTGAQRREAEHLADLLEAMSRSMRAGMPQREALRRACLLHGGPLSVRFRTVLAGLDLGEPFEQALTRLTHRATATDLGPVVALLAMVSRSGTGGARALTVGSGSIRQGLALHHEINALVAQAKLSATIVAVLPPAFVGIGVLTGQAGADVLFSTTFGRWCLAIGLALDLVGLAAMRRLVHRVAA